MYINFDTVNDATGFANGDEFDTASQVRDYFTPEAQIEMVGNDALADADLLAEYAEAVIDNRWHCRDGFAATALHEAAPIGLELAEAVLAQQQDGIDRWSHIVAKALDFIAKATKGA